MTVTSPIVYNKALNPKEGKMTTITISQARELIDETIANFNGEVSLEVASTINQSVNADIQLRDYLLGLPIEHGVEKTSQFLGAITSLLSADETYGLDTVNAMFNYELGNDEMVKALISKVEISNSNYSLLGLAKRVFEAGWPRTGFKPMRESLHQSVIENLEENSDFEIEIEELAHV